MVVVKATPLSSNSTSPLLSAYTVHALISEWTTHKWVEKKGVELDERGVALTITKTFLTLFKTHARYWSHTCYSVKHIFNSLFVDHVMLIIFTIQWWMPVVLFHVFPNPTSISWWHICYSMWSQVYWTTSCRVTNKVWIWKHDCWSGYSIKFYPCNWKRFQRSCQLVS